MTNIHTHQRGNGLLYSCSVSSQTCGWTCSSPGLLVRAFELGNQNNNTKDKPKNRNGDNKPRPKRTGEIALTDIFQCYITSSGNTDLSGTIVIGQIDSWLFPFKVLLSCWITHGFTALFYERFTSIVDMRLLWSSSVPKWSSCSMTERPNSSIAQPNSCDWMPSKSTPRSTENKLQ